MTYQHNQCTKARLHTRYHLLFKEEPYLAPLTHYCRLLEIDSSHNHHANVCNLLHFSNDFYEDLNSSLSLSLLDAERKINFPAGAVPYIVFVPVVKQHSLIHRAFLLTPIGFITFSLIFVHHVCHGVGRGFFIPTLEILQDLVYCLKDPLVMC